MKQTLALMASLTDLHSEQMIIRDYTSVPSVVPTPSFRVVGTGTQDLLATLTMVTRGLPYPFSGLWRARPGTLWLTGNHPDALGALQLRQPSCVFPVPLSCVGMVTVLEEWYCQVLKGKLQEGQVHGWCVYSMARPASSAPEFRSIICAIDAIAVEA